MNNIKRLFLTVLSLIEIITYSQNPISPPGVYFADPSAKMWNDGKLYLYGSLDESCDYWCSKRHHVMETADMKNWLIIEDIFNSEGPKDGVSGSNALLFAPDCQYYNGKYYLYFCMPDRNLSEGVATSNSPAGPFVDGQKIDLGGKNQIDPSCFIDDDGQVYYVWGQFTLKMAKMNPDMKSLDLSTVKDRVLTENEHFFHEGAYMTKRNGMYYLIFADISREEKPTCIGYATATSPFGPYTYGGVIVDNNGCNPGNWNNHGSIAKHGDQWYVFYHRSTHGCKTMRKACVEPISFNEDGSINEVEMTSQGAGKPFFAFEKIEAERACLMMGNVRIEEYEEKEEALIKIQDQDWAVIKYVDFPENIKKVKIRIKPYTTGSIEISAGSPWNHNIASINVDATENSEWKIIEAEVNPISGVHKLSFRFFSDTKHTNLFDIDWVVFE